MSSAENQEHLLKLLGMPKKSKDLLALIEVVDKVNGEYWDTEGLIEAIRDKSYIACNEWDSKEEIIEVIKSCKEYFRFIRRNSFEYFSNSSQLQPITHPWFRRGLCIERSHNLFKSDGIAERSIWHYFYKQYPNAGDPICCYQLSHFTHGKNLVMWIKESDYGENKKFNPLPVIMPSNTKILPRIKITGDYVYNRHPPELNNISSCGFMENRRPDF